MNKAAAKPADGGTFTLYSYFACIFVQAPVGRRPIVRLRFAHRYQLKIQESGSFSHGFS